MSNLRTAAQQALEALELGYDSAKAEADQYHAAMAGYRPQRHAEMDAEVQKIAAAITALRVALAEPDLFHCPKCGGPADNGHDRSIPPSPYWCTKCMAEPVQEPVAVVRSVVGQGDDGVRIKWLSGFPQIGDRLYAAPANILGANPDSSQDTGHAP